MKQVVLVIDDDPAVRELISDVLQSFGHRVVLACDADEGCAIARISKPTLIICDVMLPDRIGFDVVTDLQRSEATRHTPIILMTGYAYMENSTELDCVWLMKPFSVNDLMAKIDTATAKPKTAC